MPLQQRVECLPGNLAATPGIGYDFQQMAGGEEVVDCGFLIRRGHRRPPISGMLHKRLAVQAGAQLHISAAAFDQAQPRQRGYVNLVPRHPRQNVRFIMNQPPFASVLDHECGQNQILGDFSELLALPQRNRLLRLHGAFRISRDSSFQALQPLQPEAFPNFVQQFRASALKAEHVALIQLGKTRLAGIGLAQNAPNELGQRRFRAGVGQDGQHVGERAIPTLLKRLLGDDEADGAIARHESA